MYFIGEIASLITAGLWSCSSIIFTEASRKIGSQQLNINRLIVAFILLLLTNALIGIGVITSSQIFLLTISGLVGLVFGDGFLFKAFQVIGARYSMMLMSLAPALTAILAFIFLNEILSITALLGMIITIVGVAMVVSEKREKSKEIISTSGIIYGLLGALGQAAGLIIAKSAFMQGEINGFTATFIRISASVIILLPLMIFFKRYKNPLVLYSNDIKAFWLTLAGSIVGPFLGITFSLIAIKYTDIGVASTLMATVPILMIPLVRIVYKEKITSRGIIGSIVAVGGIAVLFLR
jgi:drug/metabolite transporter (DMT)-like permease